MNKDDIMQVITALVGDIEPCGSTHIDEERQKNLEVFLGVFDEMHTVIDGMIHDYKDRPEYSVRVCVSKCKNLLNEIGVDTGAYYG